MRTAVRTAVGVLQVECPVCGVELQRHYRAGVEVDVCLRCEGMWLDWGELEVLRDQGYWWAPHLRAPLDGDDEELVEPRQPSAVKTPRPRRYKNMAQPD